MELHTQHDRLAIEGKYNVQKDQNAVRHRATETAITPSLHSSSLISPMTTDVPLGDTNT